LLLTVQVVVVEGNIGGLVVLLLTVQVVVVEGNIGGLVVLLLSVQVVVVEGNIGVGKTAFAKRLAERFDLKYFPPTREKQLYLYGDGYNCDLRGFDRVMPEGLRSYDLEKFYSDPHPERGLVGRQQLLWYKEKFMDYLFALRHLLNTG